MDKAEPTCSDPDWTGTTQRIDKRPITMKNNRGKDITIGYYHWLVVDVDAVCNGAIRVPHHAEFRVGASMALVPLNYPITYERDGAVIKAGSVRFDVDEAVRGFEGRYIRELAPSAEIDQWRNFLRTTDRVESFRDRSAPQLLASRFALSSSFDREEFGPRDRWWYDPNTRKYTRTGEGINGNGMHVFQPKTWQASSQVCQEPEPELLGYAAGIVQELPFFSSVTAMRLEFALKCHGQLHPFSTRTVIIKIGEGFLGDLFPMDATEASPSEAATFMAIEDWDCSAQPLNDYTLRLLVGSKTGLYNYRHVANGLSYPLASMYLPSDKVPPVWTGQGMDGGQADQLLVKMKDVLDEHYGVGQWWNNQNAQIDLVAHSQGGLVIREMIANNPQATPDNPVSHIRQILAIGSPLHGSALATDNTVLRSPASALDADLGQKPYPELAALRDGLQLKTVSTPFGEFKVPGYDCSPTGPSVPSGCLDIKTSVAVNVKQSASSFLPFVRGIPQNMTIGVTMALEGPWLGPYSLHVFDRFHVDNIDLSYRKTLADAAAEGSYLGWPQSSAFINNLVRDLDKRNAPRYPGTIDNIPFTTLASGSVGSFVQEAVWGVSEALRGACPSGDKLWQAEYSPKGLTLARGWINCSSFNKAVSQVEAQLAAQLSPIDNGWSEQGDMVVDLGSQRGYRPSLDGWSRASSFKSTTFAYNPFVLHGPFDVNKSFDLSGSGVRLKPFVLNAAFPGASMQGCDILDQLGVTGYDKSACREPEKTGFRKAVRSRSLLQIMPSYLVSGGGSSLGKLVARLQNSNSESVPGFEVDVPVHADFKAVPTARLAGAGAATVAMVPVAKGSWIARIKASSTLEPSSFWPNENGFQLEISDPKGLPVRIAIDDSSDGWTGSVQAVVRSAQGTVLSGIDPGPALRVHSERVATSPAVDVIAEGYQTRGTDHVWTKPVLFLSNESDRLLRDFDVFYRVQAREDGAKPEIALWNVPYGVATGAADVVADGDSGWIAIIQLRGASLQPGQELHDLKFGLHWPDWAVWDVSRDPSDPGVGSLDLSLSVIDVEAIKAMNSSPEVPIETTVWKVEGLDEGLADTKYIKPRLRLTNLGEAALEGFTLRVPFTVPTGIAPVLETWYVPGCTGSLVGTGAARTAVYACPNVRVPAGATWPDASGIAFGLHAATWQAWPRGGDALTRELGASWKVLTTPEVVR